MAKLTFDEALERLNDQRYIKASDVLASALKRKIWVAEWHLPGCLSESQCLCANKKGAIECACFMVEGENGVPRGMITALRKYGRFDSDSGMYGTCINTVSQVTLADLL